MLSNLIKLKVVHQLSSVTDSFFIIYTVTVLSVMPDRHKGTIPLLSYIRAKNGGEGGIRTHVPRC